MDFFVNLVNSDILKSAKMLIYVEFLTLINFERVYIKFCLNKILSFFFTF